MKGLVARRARIVRVRRVQHLQAAAAAAQAEDRALKLESTADRLRDLRGGLAPATGIGFGAALAHVGELGDRLERARDGLTDAVAAARATAAEQAAHRLAARIREESALRLKERAEVARAADRERRAAAPGRRPGTPA